MRLPLSGLQPSDRLRVVTGAARDRATRTARRSSRLRSVAARLRGDSNHRLSDLLVEVMAADVTGCPVPSEDLRRLRSAATDDLRQDPTTALAALGVLADRFGDSGARAWIGPALADAGHLAAAADRGAVFARGRPRVAYYALLVTALHHLGRRDEAAGLAAELDSRFPDLANTFTHIWADDPLGTAYRRLVRDSPGRHDRLPVFQHLPFCGGSSMQFGLQRVVPWGRTVQIGRRSGLREIAAIQSAGPQRLTELMLVHQHHPFPLELPGRSLCHFTVLRDPVSQLRSGFYKRGAREQIVATRDTRSATFEQHADYLLAAGMTNLLTRMLITTHPELRSVFRRRFDRPSRFVSVRSEEDMFWLPATRGFSDQKLLRLAEETLQENFAVVGTMAELPASHLACTATIGVPYAALLGHRGRSGQPTSTHDSPTDRRLREANAVDQHLYETYTERFIAEHAELINALAPQGDRSSGQLTG